jgi:hypothetical protein
MFKMGFMGILLQPFINCVENININVKTYETLYKSKFASAHTTLRPRIDTV